MFGDTLFIGSFNNSMVIFAGFSRASFAFLHAASCCLVNL